MKEIIFAGFGGQGVLTGGMVLAYMASVMDLNPIWMPSYGASMRGGKANCVVKYGDSPLERIGSPMMEEADALIAMNQPALDFLEFCKPAVKVFINVGAVSQDFSYPSGVDLFKIDCVALASRVGNPKGANLVMLGAAIEKCGLFEEAFAEKALCDYFEGHGKGAFNDINVAALRAGFAAV